jgi:hypothetical protein
MALVISNFPVDYSSANDDLVCTCLESSLYSQTNFKYICDVYIGGVKVAQLKSFPNPVSFYGVFNIGNVVRNYVNSNLTYLPLTAGIRVDIFSNHTKLVECKFGYEYGAIVTQFLNIETRSKSFSNSYNKRRVFNITTVPTMSYKTDRFATNRPTLRTNVFLPGSGVPAAPVLIPFYSITVYPSSPQNLVFRVNRYSIDGTYTLSSAITSTNARIDNTMTQYDMSARSLNTALGTTFIDDNTLFYNVFTTIEISASVFVTETSPNFYPYCESKYEVFTIIWLNQFGGYDSYQFSKKSKRSYASEKKSFERIPYNVNPANGVMNYVQMSGSTSSKVFVENQIVYDSKFKESLVLNTDIIDESTYDWLSELIISPCVFLFSNDSFVPIMIKDSNYDFKKRVNDKVFNLTINVDLQQQMNTQYR